MKMALDQQLHRIASFDSPNRERILTQAVYRELDPHFQGLRTIPAFQVGYDDGFHTRPMGTAIVNGGNSSSIGIRSDGTVDQSHEWYQSPLGRTGPLLHLFLDFAN